MSSETRLVLDRLRADVCPRRDRYSTVSAPMSSETRLVLERLRADVCPRRDRYSTVFAPMLSEKRSVRARELRCEIRDVFFHGRDDPHLPLSRAERFTGLPGSKIKNFVAAIFPLNHTTQKNPFTPRRFLQKVLPFVSGAAGDKRTFLQATNNIFQFWGVTPPAAFFNLT